MKNRFQSSANRYNNTSFNYINQINQGDSKNKLNRIDYFDDDEDEIDALVNQPSLNSSDDKNTLDDDYDPLDDFM